jgi:hypothetical protein
MRYLAVTERVLDTASAQLEALGNLMTGVLFMTRLRFLLCSTMVILLCGCFTSKEAFLNVKHRENYAIENAELLELQFFISKEVLVKDVSSADRPLGAESVILVPAETPGRAIEVGENWIRVSFEEGGQGAVFLTNPSQRDDGYWLATEVPGETGYRKLVDSTERILHHQGRRLQVVYGADAYLLVSKEDLKHLVSRRRHLQGRQK